MTDLDNLGRTVEQLKKQVAALQRQSRLGSASLDNKAIEVKDGGGGLRAIVGQQGDGTTAVNVVNGPPPPAPSMPTVVPVLGGVAASWDGTFTDGQVMPLDWARIEVHAAPDNGFTPTQATLIGTVETAQGATVVIPTEDPLYVVLAARNTSGTASTPSAQAGPVGPTAVVATDILDGIVTEVKLADDAVTQAKIATAAVGSTQIEDDAVTTEKIIAGAILAGQIATGAVLTDKLAANAVTAAKIASLAITTDKLAANAITAGKIAAGAVDATALKADAITGKTITGGVVTGSLIQTADAGAAIVLNQGNNNALEVYDEDDNVVIVIGSGPPAQITSYTRGGGNLSTRIEGGRIYFADSDEFDGEIPSMAADVTGVVQVNGSSTDAATSNARVRLIPGSGTGTLMVDSTVGTAGITATGPLAASNIASGHVTITPTAANTPTSFVVTGLHLTGGSPRAVATATTTVPGTAVTGVGINPISSTSMTIWLTRTAAAATGIDWIAFAS